MKRLQNTIAILMVLLIAISSCTSHDSEQETDRRERTDISVSDGKAAPAVAATSRENKRVAAAGADVVGRRYVTKGNPSEIRTDDVTLLIDSGSVCHDVEIIIAKMGKESTGEIPSHMENLTAGGYVYRMLPDGQRFEKDITLAMRYDSTALPYGYTAEDIYTFFYDESTHMWQQVERDSVDTENQIVYSRTNHFTDYINGVLKVPESNDAMAYTPTSIKDLKAADPMEGITMIAPPEANNMGTANLSYPLQIPAGRRGMQPQLAITYNSGGGSGILGLGWNMHISEICVDTRRGVPLYSDSLETETYTLDGEVLVTSYWDMNEKLHLNKPAYRSWWQERFPEDTVLFYRRVEGAFQRIQRIGTSPQNYRWVVTDKKGTKYYYGDSMQSTLRTRDSNISHWYLSRVEDVYGNNMVYIWEHRMYINTMFTPGEQVLLKRIDYTGHNDTTGRYHVHFVYTQDPKEDASISSRSGAVEADAFLLDRINVTFDDELIRTYFVGYRLGMFGKTLMCNIVEAAPLDETLERWSRWDHTRRHVEEPEVCTPLPESSQTESRYTKRMLNREPDFYYDDYDIIDVSGYPFLERDVYARCAVTDAKSEYFRLHVHRFEYDTISVFFGDEMFVTNISNQDDKIEGPLFLISSAPGPIEGTGTCSYNIGGGLDVGFGTNTFLKSLTAGGNYNYTSNGTEGLLSLVDLNGDGFTDKIYKNKKGVCYRLRSSSNPLVFGRETCVVGQKDFLLSEGHSNTWGIEGNVGVGSDTANLGVNFGISWNYGTSAVTTYLCDADGDGLPDLVKDGTVHYNRIGKYPDKVFVRPNSDMIRDTLSVCGNLYIDTIYYGESVSYDLFEDYEGDSIWITVCSNGLYEKPDNSLHDTVICEDVLVYNNYTRNKPYEPDLENVRIWRAPYTGDVSISGMAQMNTSPFQDGNGVQIIVQKDTLLFDNRLSYVSPLSVDIDRISVNKGDKIFFRIQSRGDRTCDRVHWNPTVRYISLSTDSMNINDSIGADGLNRFVFDYGKDFLLTGCQKVMMPYKATIRIMENVEPVRSAISLNSPVLLQIFVNDTLRHCDTIDNTGTHLDKTYFDHVRKYDEIQAKMVALGPTDWSALDAKCRISIVENNSQDTSDAQFECLDTLSIEGDTLYFYDWYPQIEKCWGSTDSVPLFGSMYRNWGQFAYKSPDGSRLLDTNLLRLDKSYGSHQSDSTRYTDRTNDDILTVTEDNPETMAEIGGVSVYNPLSSSFFLMQPDFRNNCWSAHTDYAYIEREMCSNVPHPAIGMTILQADSINHAVQSPIYNAFSTLINKISHSRGRGISASCNVNINEEIFGRSLLNGGGFGINNSTSMTSQFSDVMDLNGDGIPDVLSETKVQYSQPQGGLSNKIGSYCIDGTFLDCSYDTVQGGTFSGSHIFTRRGTANSTRKSSMELSFTPGASLSNTESSGGAIVSWLDINGDGLPDKVTSERGELYYYLNQGYGFMGKRLFNNGEMPRQSYSSGQSGGLSFAFGNLLHYAEADSILSIINSLQMPDSLVGVPQELLQQEEKLSRYLDSLQHVKNELKQKLSESRYKSRFNVSISAGMNKSSSNNNTTLAHIDLNGDGLPDQMEKYRNGYLIRFHNGNSFGGGVAVIHLDADTDNVSMTTDMSAAITVGVTLGVIPLKIEVNPKGGLCRSMNSTRAQWMDMNGDGIPDYVWSKGDTICVKVSNLGKANRLRKVTIPSHGEYDISYRLNQDGCSSNGSHYVMSELVVRDPVMNSKPTRRTYHYRDRYYDRHERDDYGYAWVTTIDHDTVTGFSECKRTTRHFLNEDYLFRGLCDSITVSCHDTILYSEYYHYGLMDIIEGNQLDIEPGCHGDGYPAVAWVETTLFDNSQQSITGRQQFGYGGWGNLEDVDDFGDLADTHDDYFATTRYDTIGDYLFVVKEESVFGGSARRHRLATYNPFGDIDTLTFVLGTNDSVSYFFDYDPYGNISRITYPENHQGQRFFVSYIYDPETHTLPIQTTNAHGLSSEACYSYLWQKPLWTESVNGARCTYLYDRYGRLKELHAPFEQSAGRPTIRYDYDDAYTHHESHWDTSLLWAKTDNLNDDTCYIRTITISDGLGRPRIVKKTAAVNGIPSRIVSGWVEFDAVGRKKREYHPTFESLADGETSIGADITNTYFTEYLYDPMDRVTKVLFPDSTEQTLVYSIGADADGIDRIHTSVTDQNGNTSHGYTNIRNQQTALVDPLGAVTKFHYDNFGQLIETIDPEGYSTTHRYDDLGRRIERHHPSSGHTRWLYDPSGNMIQQVQNDGSSVQYTYEYNRVNSVSYSDHPWNNVQYKYGLPSDSTQAGRVTRQQDATGVQEFSYDLMGNVIRNRHTYVLPCSSSIFTLTSSWSYDSWGRVRTITYPDGELVSYHYDCGGMLDSVAGQKPHMVQTPYIRSILYDHFSQRTSVVNGNNVTTTYSYYPDNRRLRTLMDYSCLTGDTLQKNKYDYDLAGNILAITDHGRHHRLQKFSYDSTNRLVKSKGEIPGLNVSYDNKYSYSPAGRFLSKSVTSQRLSTAMGFTTVNYDNMFAYGTDNPFAVREINDNVSGKHTEFQWDLNGNMIHSECAEDKYENSLCWTEDNRLQGFYSINSDGMLFSYYNYSADGTRNLKLVSPRIAMLQNAEGMSFLPAVLTPTLYASPLITVNKHGYVKHYFEEGRRICSKLGESNDTNDWSGPNTPVNPIGSSYEQLANTSYTGLSESANQCFMLQTEKTKEIDLSRSLLANTVSRQGEPVFFYHSDHLGSASYLTDRNGNITQTLNYLPYGEDWVDIQHYMGARYSNMELYTFTGKEKDSESGYHYFGARYYDSELLTGWLSVDPMSDKYPGISPYNYCAWNPVKFIDPNGLSERKFEDYETGEFIGEIDDGVDEQVRITRDDYAMLNEFYNNDVRNGDANLSLYNNMIERYSIGLVGYDVAQTAKKYENSMDWNYNVRKGNFPAGSYKCNKFVYDVLSENGVAPQGEWPPQARAWAGKGNIPGWSIVSQANLGDVVAGSYNYSDATGHVVIVTGIDLSTGNISSMGTVHSSYIGDNGFGNSMVNKNGWFDGKQFVPSIRRYTGGVK